MTIKLNPKSRATFNWAAKRAAADVPAAEKKLAELREVLVLAETKWESDPANVPLRRRIAELEDAITEAEAALAEARRLHPQWLAIVEQYEEAMA